MNNLKLFKLVLGFKPDTKNTEQHDVFFGIGASLQDLQEEIRAHLPEVDGRVHIDTWEEVQQIDGYRIDVIPRNQKGSTQKLFFVNVGWYPGSDREDHATIFVIAKNVAEASIKAKQTKIFQELLKKGVHKGNAATHLDDKFAPDDILDVELVVSKSMMLNYSIRARKYKHAYRSMNDMQITGFLKLSDLPSYKFEKGGF